MRYLTAASEASKMDLEKLSQAKDSIQSEIQSIEIQSSLRAKRKFD